MRENWQNSKITFRIILFILFQCAKSKPFPCKSYFWTAHKPFHIGWNLQKFSKPEFFPNLSKLFKRLKNLVHNTYQVIHLRSSATRRDEKSLTFALFFVTVASNKCVNFALSKTRLLTSLLSLEMLLKKSLPLIYWLGKTRLFSFAFSLNYRARKNATSLNRP